MWLVRYKHRTYKNHSSNSLEELLELIAEVDYPVVISKDDPMPEIEIYDDYRE